MGMIEFSTDEMRLRRLVSQAYASRQPFRGRSAEGKALLTEDGCTARDLRGLMLEEAIGRCVLRATTRRVVNSSTWLGDPTCVDAGDAMAMLVHVALVELLLRVKSKVAADALVIIADAIRAGEGDLREIVLATLDDAVHGHSLTK